MQHLDDEPHFGGDAQHRKTPPDSFTREERAICRLDRHKRDDPVERELAVQEAETEDEPAPARAAPREPDQEDIQKRLEVAAARLKELRGRAGRAENEEHARGARIRGPEAHFAFENPQEQDRDRQVDREERELERRDRDAEQQEHRRRHPGFDAKNVALTVQEDGKRAQLAEVLRHQAHHGLIGIEERLAPEDEDRRAGEDEQDDEREDDPSFVQARTRHATVA